MSEERVKAVWRVADIVTERRIDSDEYLQIVDELSSVIQEAEDEDAKKLCAKFLEKSKPILRSWLQEEYPAICAFDRDRRQKVLCTYLKRILRGELLGSTSGTCHPRADDARMLLQDDLWGWELAYERLQDKTR